jgi:LPXTG-motif cell wall-anchored protein
VPTLAVTGVDPAGPLSLGAVLLALGATTLVVRRKRARA